MTELADAPTSTDGDDAERVSFTVNGTPVTVRRSHPHLLAALREELEQFGVQVTRGSAGRFLVSFPAGASPLRRSAEQLADIACGAASAGAGCLPVAVLTYQRVRVLHRDGQPDAAHDRQVNDVITHIGGLLKGKPKLG